MTDFLPLTRRTADPKLRVLERLLNHVCIETRRNGESSHAPILEVPATQHDEAETILSLSLSDMLFLLCEVIGHSGTHDLTLRRGIDITFDDVPDDDPAFHNQE